MHQSNINVTLKQMKTNKITTVMSQHKIQTQAYNFLIESCIRSRKVITHSTEANNKILFRGSASVIQRKSIETLKKTKKTIIRIE